MKDGGHGVITFPHVPIYSALEDVSDEYDAPAALPPEQKPPYLLDRWLVGGGKPQGPSGDFGKGKSFISDRNS